jgi:hypothetical protein
MKHTVFSWSIPAFATFSRPSALSLNSNSLSTFSYSFSTNLVKNRIRDGESDARLEKRDNMIPRICPVSSEAGVVDPDFGFFDVWNVPWCESKRKHKTVESTDLAHESREQRL